MIKKIEDAIINELKRYHLAKIISYGGDITENMIKSKSNNDNMACAVSFVGDSERPTLNGSGTMRVYRRFAVDIISKSSRDEATARKTAYDTIDNIQAILLGNDFGLDIEPLLLEPIDILANEDDENFKNIIVYSLPVTTSYYVEKRNNSAPADLNHIDSDGTVTTNINFNEGE